MNPLWLSKRISGNGPNRCGGIALALKVKTLSRRRFRAKNGMPRNQFACFIGRLIGRIFTVLRLTPSAFGPGLLDPRQPYCKKFPSLG